MASEDKDLVTNPASVQTSEVSSPETPLKTGGNLAWGQRLWENVQILGIALILALVIRSFIAEPRYIPSDSMVPTLQIGDRLVVEKISYLLHPPQAGDIIVFDPPTKLQIQGYSKDQAFIKRVIGVPGNTVQIHAGQVSINHEPLSEAYIAEPPNYELAPVIVPAGKLFVMGDNRNNSNDSHVWGFLPQENVIGRAFFRFWPLDRLGGI